MHRDTKQKKRITEYDKQTITIWFVVIYEEDKGNRTAHSPPDMVFSQWDVGGKIMFSQINILSI